MSIEELRLLIELLDDFSSTLYFNKLVDEYQMIESAIRIVEKELEVAIC